MLTLYYMSTTILQSWRIQKACNKIGEQLALQTSVAFYTLQKGTDDGFDPTIASSELCHNHKKAKVTDILWLYGNQRGCCLAPLQKVHIGPWISFPKSPSWLPFAVDSTTSISSSTKIERPHARNVLSVDKDKHLQLLLEANFDQQHNAKECLKSRFSEMAAVRLEDYCELIAWKVDSHLAMIVRTDVENLMKLLISTFLRNNLFINDSLPLLRIETVQQVGNPQPFELLANHLKRSTRNAAELSAEDWQKHLDDLRALSILARQATEFENQKNHPEVKSGIATDLLAPCKAVAVVEPTNKSAMSSQLSKTKELRIAEGAEASQRNALLDKADNTNNSLASAKLIVQEKNSRSVRDYPESLMPSDSTNDIINNDYTEPRRKMSFIRSPMITSTYSSKVESTKATLTTDGFRKSKPLNIVVYSESGTARDSTLVTLRKLLENNVYTIYSLSPEEVAQKHWCQNSALLIVCGAVTPSIGKLLVDYFLHGGKLLSLCSDILNYILPNYRTAEVREHELVQFSFDKWQKVQMLHYVFCYQPSPVKRNFSTDSEEPIYSTKPSFEMTDLDGEIHKLDVKILASEETWNTPSLLLAISLQSDGKAFFSQVHLETSPVEFEMDEKIFAILQQSENTRLEIFADILCQHFNINVINTKDKVKAGVAYKEAYLLGLHEMKLELMQKLRLRYRATDSLITTPKITIKFCGENDLHPEPQANVLPILTYSCPDEFSTVEYFNHLKTKHIGRLVIYAPIISSSMDVINDLELMHGLAVLPIQQMAGVGRSNNQWLSPLGCAMFSIQLHIPLDSPIGTRLPLIQHIIGAAVVNTFSSHALYKVLNIGLKWPNDIYAYGNVKIGGVVVNSTLAEKHAFVNVGCGINLNNSKPTICVNDLITEYNGRTTATKDKLPSLKYENIIALIFNEIERILEEAQNDNFASFYILYYRLWLHSNQNVSIWTQSKDELIVKIIGIDDYGFLKVQLPNSSIRIVKPDGNSFDMLKGLIVNKIY